MSEIVGIICEYNPFHKGHKYQINKIKKEMPDAEIVAIMSGNVVQRGEFAFLDKEARAKAAIEMGVSLVLQIPYPYSASCAEIFANAGVDIAQKVGCSYLCFGTEELEIEEIEKIAQTIDSKEFNDEIKKYIIDKSESYICAREKALEGLKCSLPKSSNDMLAVEYVRAINKKEYPLKPWAIKRKGAMYRSYEICDVMSAGAIRRNFYENGELASIPAPACKIFNLEIENGKYLNYTEYSNFLHRYSLVVDPREIEKACDSVSGIGFLIKEIAKNSSNGENFLENLSTKSYTKSRLKRIILYSLFNVKEVTKALNFAILLAANENGRRILSGINDGFSVVTKNADAKRLDPVSAIVYQTDLYADELYNTLLQKSISPANAYKKRPIIK